ncbi:outer membrane protein assembly factor BamC [Burkholderiaceae bacterium DAT-1]|nr:outer membrane protein assembly factor BamC [Burkholderiaceae bacterium DAT-1]
MNSNQRKLSRPIAVMSLAMFAAGCAHIPFVTKSESDADKNSYRQSRESLNQKRLDIPPELTAPESRTAFDIPGVTSKQLSAEGKKAMEAGTVSAKFTKVSLQSDGAQRWLVVDASVEQVWGQVRQFMLDKGFELTVDNPVAGLLETNFAHRKSAVPDGMFRSAITRVFGNAYSTDFVDQYRVRVERSADDKRTEVFISHSAMKEAELGSLENSNVRWMAVPNDPEYSAFMLKQLLVRIGATEENASAVASDASKPVAAPAPAQTAGKDGAKKRVQAVKIDGVRGLQLYESFDRSWRRVGLAVERAGYAVADRDRRLGVYYIRKGKPDDLANKNEKGFWEKLAFWRDDKADKIDNNKTPKGTEYQVAVSAYGSDTLVKVTGKDGNTLNEKMTEELLSNLESELQ